MRDFTVRLAIMSKNKIRNAPIRLFERQCQSNEVLWGSTHIAQGKPTLGISLLNMMGNMTPPRLEPAAVIPLARPLRLRNQVAIQLTAALEDRMLALGPGDIQVQRLTRSEQAADSNRTTDTLRKKNLVVLRRDRCHHESKDVHECAEEQELTGTKSIVDSSDDKAL